MYLLIFRGFSQFPVAMQHCYSHMKTLTLRIIGSAFRELTP